jgi:branched-chain amino acid transport system permease protein
VVIIGLLLGTIYAVISLGLSLTFGVLKFINFAHGDFLMLAMYASFWGFVLLRIDPFLSPILTVPFFFGIGVLTYKAMVKRVLGSSQLTQIALTVGMLMVFKGLALVAWGAHPRGVPVTMIRGVINLGDISLALSRVVSALVGFGAIVVVHLFLTRTSQGMAARALSDDRHATVALGVNTDQIYALTFGLGIALAALGGGLLMTFSPVTPETGLTYSLLVWIVVVLAGLGTVKGILFSGWIVGTIQAVTTLLLGARASLLIVYLLFILILWIRPRGLWGVR